MVTIPHRSGPSPSRCPGLKAWKVTVRSVVKASPGTSPLAASRPLGTSTARTGASISVQELATSGSEPLNPTPNSASIKRCCLRLAQGLDPNPGCLCSVGDLRGRRVAFLGRAQGVDRDGATSSGQILGSDVAVATVVAGPGEDRDTNSVSGTHFDRRKCHCQPGSLHQDFDRFGGSQIEPTGFFGGDHQLHGVSISVRKHRAQSQLSARPSRRQTPAPDRRCG